MLSEAPEVCSATPEAGRPAAPALPALTGARRCPAQHKQQAYSLLALILSSGSTMGRPPGGPLTCTLARRAAAQMQPAIRRTHMQSSPALAIWPS